MLVLTYLVFCFFIFLFNFITRIVEIKRQGSRFDIVEDVIVVGVLSLVPFGNLFILAITILYWTSPFFSKINDKINSWIVGNNDEPEQ